MVRLYLLRHGETRYNRENLGLGRADIELTAVGKKQSELTADSLEGVVFEMIYSSPLSRAAYLANLVDRDTCVVGKNQTTLNYISPENENIVEGYEFTGIDFLGGGVNGNSGYGILRL